MRLLPGLTISAALAIASVNLGRLGWMQEHGFSALTLAIVLGMLVGNTVYPRFAAVSGPGVGFSKQWLLRLGVVLYGMRPTGQDIGHVGFAGVAIDALVVGSTFLLACFIGIRLLGMDRKTAMLIAVGNSICGAAAVMGAEPIVRARAEQVTVAIATVVAFGTLAIFLYPALYELNQHWQIVPGGTQGFGIYVGSTVHEVAQVIAAARPVGPEAGDTAVVAKMVRVMMLAPVLLGLSWWLARDEARRSGNAAGHGDTSGQRPAKIAIPWFALAFIAAVGFNSLRLLPAGLVGYITEIDAALLATAMAALGLSTHAASIRKAGMKPLLLASILFFWLVIGGALINRWLPQLAA
jgi:uncharacterized integral membrane protein (TIGR00698 family)